jgi:putative restriction endonuclease
MTNALRAYVALTDGDWFKLLAAQTDLEEINFWQPGGNRRFSVLSPGELFLFKLKAPVRAIVGGGFFAYSTILPLSFAWETFEIGNGARSLMEMQILIERNRHKRQDAHEDYNIGCVLLNRPFFLRPEEWIEEPPDWPRGVQQGKTYTSDSVTGRRLIQQVEDVLRLHNVPVQTPIMKPSETGREEKERYGKPTLVIPRLGQRSFRWAVTDAYDRRCAISGEKVLPVLDAAHIHPYDKGGQHEIQNGLLLRMDLHRLFDRGYITITPKYRLEVSKRIHEEFDNGKEYSALHGGKILLPKRILDAPGESNLEWHNTNIFRG